MSEGKIEKGKAELSGSSLYFFYYSFQHFLHLPASIIFFRSISTALPSPLQFIMGACPSKARVTVSKVEKTETAGETILDQAQQMADVVQSDAANMDAKAVVGVASSVSTLASSVVPWLVGTIDTFVPSLPFGATIASLIKKCYNQACALKDAKGEAAKLSRAVALVAKDLDALNSALAAVKEAVQGGSTGDMKKQVSGR